MSIGNRFLSPTSGGRPARSGRALLPHHERQDLGEPPRAAALKLPGAPPPARLVGGGRGRSEMKVYVPTPLRSYTGNRPVVQAAGSTVAELLSILDGSYPGILSRIIDEQAAIGQHIKLVGNSEQVQRLDTPVALADELHIICALSRRT